MFRPCRVIIRPSFILIIISSFYSLWSTGHPWRVSKRCDLQLSPWPHSMIFLYPLFRPLLFFATFSSVYLFFYIPEDSNPMQFLLLLLLPYVRCVLSSSIFFITETNRNTDRKKKAFIINQLMLTHYSGRVTQICVFNTVKLDTSASSP